MPGLLPLFILICGLSLLLSACADAPSSAAPVATEPDTVILVWQAAGSTPLENTRPPGGVIGLLESDGDLHTFFEVPADARHVRVCGDAATSPDGRLFAFYVGHNTGRIYLMTGRDQPAEIGSAALLSCLGHGTFSYAPDSQRLAYIDYGSAPTDRESISGILKVFSTDDPREIYRHDNITAFDISADGLAFMRFFTNSRGQVDEAVLLWWDGNREREVATLRPDRDCRYSSASMRLAADNTALLLMGHRCTNLGTAWQLYRVYMDDSRVSLIDSAAQRGTFASYTRTNTLLISPDGKTAFFTVPDGVTAYTAGLMQADLDEMSTSTLVERQLVMPTLTRVSNTAPLLSPDGRWLAAVQTTPNDDNTLTVLDLANPGAAPYSFSTGRRGDVISGMHFTPDSAGLYFVAGRLGSGRDTETSLIQLNLTTGESARLRRGAYAPGMVLAPGAAAIGTLEYALPEDQFQPVYLNLVSVDANGESARTLFEGATLADGRVTAQQFAFPLSWRP